MENIKTLEDLRIFLEKEFDEKFKLKFKNAQDKDEYLEIFKHFYNFTDNYELSSEELDYVMPVKITMEEQSHNQTFINGQTAQNILLKLKAKNNG